MNERQATITYIYYFFSEALIAFVALIPILHVYFHHIPYFPYLYVMVGFTLLFTLIRRWTTHYATYLLTAPLMLGAFYLLKLPWLLCIFLTFFFLWRAINLRSNDTRREQTYLRRALLLSVFSALIIDDYRLIIYLFILFLVLLTGYLCRHLVVKAYQREQRFNPLIWLYLVLSIVVTTGMIYLLFPAVRLTISTLWHGFIAVIIFIGGKIVQLIFSFNIFKGEWDREEVPQQAHGEAKERHLEELEVLGLDIFDLMMKTIFWIVIIAIVGYLLWRAYRFYQQRFKPNEESPVKVDVIYQPMGSQREKGQNLFHRVFTRFQERPRHPVRQLVYDLEKKLVDTPLARRSNETIDEWVKRVSLDAKLDIYQDVRYGQLEVTTEDTNRLRRQVEKIETLLLKRKDI